MDEVEHLKAQVKGEIRRRRQSVRRAMPRDAREARSAALTTRVLALPEWERASTVLAFVSMPTEVQTGALVEAAWNARKRVATPRMNASFDALTLRQWQAADTLEESGMRFLQPTANAPTIPDEEIDLVLVPALAVDERGFRVGYGKGYYDRLLPRLTRAFRLALVFDFERIAEVPDHAGDVPVHAIATDLRIVRVG